MGFHVCETGQTVRALYRPVVIITSSNEKDLPHAFLRRSRFHFIRFADDTTLRAIVAVHHPAIKQALPAEAPGQFLALRQTPGLRKKPSPSEGPDWLKQLLAEDPSAEDLNAENPSAEDLGRAPGQLLRRVHGALLKTEQDVQLFEKLAVMVRRQRQEERGPTKPAWHLSGPVDSWARMKAQVARIRAACTLAAGRHGFLQGQGAARNQHLAVRC